MVCCAQCGALPRWPPQLSGPGTLALQGGEVGGVLEA